MVREVKNRFSSMFYAKNKPIYAFRRKMGYPPNPYAKSGENLTLDRPEKIGQTGIWVPHLLSGVLLQIGIKILYLSMITSSAFSLNTEVYRFKHSVQLKLTRLGSLLQLPSTGPRVTNRIDI